MQLIVGEYRRSSISLLADMIIVRDSSPRVTTNGEEECHITLAEITMKNPKLDWFETHMSCSATTSKLRENIISDKALTVSGGSYYPLIEVGVCAWIISIPDGKERVQGGGVIPGPKKSKTAIGPNLVASWVLLHLLSQWTFHKGYIN